MTEAEEETEVLTPGYRVAARIVGPIFLVVAVGLPILAWFTWEDVSMWTWVVVAMASSVAFKSGLKLMEAARTGIGAKYIERNEL